MRVLGEPGCFPSSSPLLGQQLKNPTGKYWRMPVRRGVETAWGQPKAAASTRLCTLCFHRNCSEVGLQRQVHLGHHWSLDQKTLESIDHLPWISVGFGSVSDAFGGGPLRIEYTPTAQNYQIWLKKSQAPFQRVRPTAGIAGVPLNASHSLCGKQRCHGATAKLHREHGGLRKHRGFLLS